ncbi:MAG: hypothetical protein WCQ20_12780 [Synechococcaceae cyanobacterium ELA739]
MAPASPSAKAPEYDVRSPVPAAGLGGTVAALGMGNDDPKAGAS